MLEQPDGYLPDGQSLDTGSAEEPAYRYLLCHGCVIAGQGADLCGTTVGVYPHFGEILPSADGFTILLHDLPPVYVLTGGQCPEFSLAPLTDAEEDRWIEADHLLGTEGIDSIDAPTTLSEYMRGLDWKGGKTMLRLVCCAGRTDGDVKPAKLAAPRCWQKTSIRSDTVGRIMDETVAGNNTMRAVLQYCKDSWPAAVAYLSSLEKVQIAAICLRGETGAFVVRCWQAWQHVPELPDSAADWVEFLEVLTPDADAAKALCASWQREKPQLISLCLDLAGTFSAIATLLADGYSSDIDDSSCLEGFLSLGWEPGSSDDSELDNELNLLLDGVDEVVGQEPAQQAVEQQGTKRKRDDAVTQDANKRQRK